MRTLGEANISPRDAGAIAAAAGVLRREFGATAVFLFGSVARGESREHSDVDLLILLPRVVSFAERLAVSEALSPVGRLHGVLFNTVVAPASSWPRGPYPLCEAVLRDGVAA